MLVPNRHGSSSSYRYGFNGKEKDDEIKGEGNSYDFGARMLDPRVGRWFARDPLSQKYPYDSPYMFSGNSPISMMDPDGERKRKITLIYDESGNLVDTQVTLVDYSLIEKKVYIRDKITIFGFEISDNQAIAYDYYDSVDIEVAVRDKKGTLYGHTIIQKGVLADKRLEEIHPIWADGIEAGLKKIDKLDDEGKEGSSLQGNAKGHFNGGIDFYLDDDGSILNVRGLEKMNSGANVERVEVSELMAIGNNQASMTSKVPFRTTTLGHIHDGGKAPDIAYGIADKIKEALADIKEKMDSKKEQKQRREVINIKEPDSITRTNYNRTTGKKIKSERIVNPDKKSK